MYIVTSHRDNKISNKLFDRINAVMFVAYADHFTIHLCQLMNINTKRITKSNEVIWLFPIHGTNAIGHYSKWKRHGRRGTARANTPTEDYHVEQQMVNPDTASNPILIPVPYSKSSRDL
jgi:hypothetical protein